MTDEQSEPADLAALRGRLTGTVHAPGDDGWDTARLAWNLAVDQRPALVAAAAGAADVATVVRYAAANGLRVAPQATGHNAGPLGTLGDTILLRTSAIDDVHVDPEARRARVGAGTRWRQVVDATQGLGLVGLAGSSPDVGVVGYSVGGGIGMLARRHGIQANAVVAADLVAADGQHIRADDDENADVFWALRGGGGNFGVVTAIEFELFEEREFSGGSLGWDWAHAHQVVTRWRDWAAEAPEEVTSSVRLMQLPPLPQVPEPLRGRQLVMITGVFLGTPHAGTRLFDSLRELGPELDTFGPVPAAALVHLNGDPEQPVPSVGAHALLDELTDEAIETWVGLAGPGSGSPLLLSELRQLGGAVGRVPERHGCLPTVPAAFASYNVGIAVTPELGAASLGHAERVAAAFAPWGSGRTYLNFAEAAIDTSTAYDPDAYQRLRAIRAKVDPGGVIRSNHAIPGA